MILLGDYVILSGIFVFLGVIHPGSPATSLSEKIYYNLDTHGFSMCFRRFNATHQIGCSSDRGGNVGVVHVVNDYRDINWLEETGSHPPYIAVVSIDMFKGDVYDRLVKSKRVNGLVVLVTNETQKPDEFSPDAKCPNDRSGLYSRDGVGGSCDQDTLWNPDGNGLMFQNVPFPMVTVSNSTDISFIINNCYEKFNNPNSSSGYPLCAMEIRDVMDGAKDTETCFRRSNLQNNLFQQDGFCDALGDLNVFSFLDSLNKSTFQPGESLSNDSVVVIAARLDAFSLFDGRYPGYDSAVLGFVTVHAIAEALGRAKMTFLEALEGQSIMFALFHGEAFDYMGSERMVYDMARGQIRYMRLESINAFIEIGQVFPHDGSDSLWIHADPQSIKNPDIKSRVESLVTNLKDFGSNVGLKINSTSLKNRLPPASLQQFLKAQIQNPKMAGIFISNHEKGFTNRYYNSIFDKSDDSSNSSTYNLVTPVVEHIKKLSTVVAQTVVSVMTGMLNVAEIESDNVTIANLIYCFTKNSDCELFNATVEYGNAEILRKSSLFRSRYVAVFNSESYKATQQHLYLLARFLGTVMENVTTQEGCKNLSQLNDGYSYHFLNGNPISASNSTRVPQCIKSVSNVSFALSPAFELSGYDWSSNQYSAWTESRWGTDAMQMRVFLLPNPSYEILILCIGIGILLISGLLVFLLQRKAVVLFRSADE